MLEIKHLNTGILAINTYVVPCSTDNNDGKRDVFVVDPGGDAELIASVISEAHANLVAIVLTHGHFDHVGALASLKEMYPKAVVCIHASDSDYVGKSGYATHRDSFNRLRFQCDEFFTHDVMPDADIFFEEGQTLPFAPDWTIIHTPGHTEGSVCLYNQNEKLLISGDTLFKQSYGRVDLPGGSFSKMKKSLEKLFQLPDDVLVYPGHESSTMIGQEKNMIL